MASRLVAGGGCSRQCNQDHSEFPRDLHFNCTVKWSLKVVGDCGDEREDGEEAEKRVP